ncbi:MAG: hypothetical protein OXF30_02475, partial [Candidatus Saccharibacteria bacterium]|nr:hypothetical protein [Candidatus Saccharibacteria bacterium]
IVEVMIVLAIAGLILAVVFVAVPAVNRNQRNTARRSDISYLRATLDTSIANNGGRLNAKRFRDLIKSDELNNLGLGRDGNFIKPATWTSASCANYGGDWASSTCTDYKAHVKTSANIVVVANAIRIHDAVVGNDEIDWQDDNTNGVLIVIGHKCDNAKDWSLDATSQETGDKADVLLLKSSVGNASFIYKIEGEDRLTCIDDVN